jgi:hypothetical protein
MMIVNVMPGDEPCNLRPEGEDTATLASVTSATGTPSRRAILLRKRSCIAGSNVAKSTPDSVIFAR